MKKLLLFGVCANLLMGTASYGQSKISANVRKCLTVEVMEKARRNNPNAETDQQFEERLERLIQQRAAFRTNISYNLPVVFHVVHNGETEGSGYNISSALIKAQLNQLNKDFLNGSGSPYSVAASADIKFSLAQVDPNGNTMATPGIDRISRSTKGWTSPGTAGWNDTYIDATIKPGSIWDPTKYLNIWVLPISDGTLGYATFPTSSGLPGSVAGETATTAGVVITSSSVGGVVTPNGTCASGNPYIMGRTMTHEIGHFFGLRHIWGDGNCATDYVDDTPTHHTQNYGTPSHPKPNACGTADEMFENFMDYTDDRIMHTFTAGQVARMQAVMMNSPRRKELATSTAGLVPAPSNKLAFTACNNSISISEKATTTSFPPYTDVRVLLNVEDVATGSATVTINASGSAVNGRDYQVMNSSLSFATGDPSKIITVRIFDDAIPEASKTIVLSYSISGSGVTAGTNNQTYTITLTDDDQVRPGENSVTILTEDFGTSGGAVPFNWGAFYTEETGNKFVVSTNGNAGGTGQAAHVTSNTSTKVNSYNKTVSSIAVLRTPLIDANGLTNLKFQYKYRAAGERYSNGNNFDYAYAVSAPSTAGTSFSQLPNATALASTSATPVVGTQTLTLPSSYDNTSFYLGIWWENDDADGNDPGINIDDVVVTADGTRIENAANTSNAFAVAPSTINHFKSRQNDKLIATISNVSTSIPQLTVSVLEAGSDRPTITTQTGTYMRTRKVFQVTPPGTDNTTSYTATFYFTPTEVAAWGGSVSNLKILKMTNSANLSGVLSSADGVIVTPTVDNKLTTDGYIAFTATFTGFSKFTLVEQNTTLPVRLLDFTGVLSGSTVKLAWKTTAEQNNHGFDVERSVDGVTFSAIGFVAGQNLSGQNNYSFDDAQIVSGNRYYYRLKQTDIDTRYSYSPVINVAYFGKEAFTWYPNPVKNKLVIQSSGTTKNATIVVTDLTGRTMYTSQSIISGKVEVPTYSWSSGVYSVRIVANGEVVTFKVVKD